MNILTDAVYLFWLCMLLHLIADYNLQGVLSNMKQERWWKKMAKSEFSNSELPVKYRLDWVAGLLGHAFMWSLITYLPFMLREDSITFTGVVMLNAFVHAIIDHTKCNLLKINLLEDQSFHIAQIVITIALLTE